MTPRSFGLIALGVVLGTVVLVSAHAVNATQAPDLGTATSFAVLAGTGVTNTGPTIINGDLGTCPTPAITGFPPGVLIGAMHAADAVACGAKSDLTTAYNDAAGQAPTVTLVEPADIGGTTLTSGVYTAPSSMAITGTLTLDAAGDLNAVFIFQAGSTLVTAANSHVVLINGAQACNVFWQVGSSATLDVGTSFVGTILALTSITANTNATVQGRLLARNGATTLDSNTVTVSACAPATTPTIPTIPPTTPTTRMSTNSPTPSATTTTLLSTSSSTSTTRGRGGGGTPPTTGSDAPALPKLPSTGSPRLELALAAGLMLVLGSRLLVGGQARRIRRPLRWSTSMRIQRALSPGAHGKSGRRCK